jgi:Na+-translocating ferredoxin:NAD+ oxidoreductase RnfD subunit
MSKKTLHRTDRFYTDSLLITAGLTVAAVYYYGFRTLAVLTVSVLTSVICGAVIAKMSRREKAAKRSENPYSGAAIPDILLGMTTGLMFPAHISYLTVFIAALFGALVCRAVFGGFMNESVSPTAVSFLFIYYAFGSGLLLSPPIFGELSLAPEIYPENLTPSFFGDIISYGVTEASGADLLFGRLPLFLGGNVILLLIGAVFFVSRRDISLVSLVISLGLFVGISLLSGVFGPKATLFSAAALLYPTLFCIMPPTRRFKSFHGKILYGIFAGLILSTFVLYTKSPAGGFFAAVLLSPFAIFLEENEFSFMSILPKKLRYVKLEKL